MGNNLKNSIMRKLIILKYKSKYFKIGTIQIAKDGTFYLFLQGCKKDDKYMQHKISYHTSGQVNYYMGSGKKILYFEPVTRITKPTFINALVISTIFMLEELIKCDESEDIIIELIQPNDIMITFYFSNNSNNEVNGVLIKLGEINFIINVQFNIKHQLSNGDAIILTPNESSGFEKTKINRDQAYIEFNNIIYNNNKFKILGPNKDGVVELITEVVMRREPLLKIEFANKNYYIKNTPIATPCNVKFKIYNKRNNQIVKELKEGDIISAFLDAEIYDTEDFIPEGFIKCKRARI